jgi:hypothetical protein
MEKSENLRRVVWFYNGREVRTGMSYDLDETFEIAGFFVAMHPDTAEDLRERGLFDAVMVH